MAGFLDPKERVIDMVLTDVGRSKLMTGNLRFVYWVPFDDEVDYNPPTPIVRTGQTLDERRQELTESPLIREATLGYRGLDLVARDATNVNRPMFTAPPGVAQRPSFLPQMKLNHQLTPQLEGQVALDVALEFAFLDAVGEFEPTSLPLTVRQQPIITAHAQKTPFGQVILPTSNSPLRFQRFGASQEPLTADYEDGAFPPNYQPEGFLLTVYASTSLGVAGPAAVSGGFVEVLHNRDSSGSICYRNDLQINNYTP